MEINSLDSGLLRLLNERADRAILLNLYNTAAQYDKACLLLLSGDLLKGFELYEHRWKIEPEASLMRNFPQPLWAGKESLKGKTILLH